MTGDNSNAIMFQVKCEEFNKSLIELYTFGYDAYRQVADQLMQIKTIPWKIQLQTVVEY